MFNVAKLRSVDWLSTFTRDKATKTQSVNGVFCGAFKTVNFQDGPHSIDESILFCDVTVRLVIKLQKLKIKLVSNSTNIVAAKLQSTNGFVACEVVFSQDISYSIKESILFCDVSVSLVIKLQKLKINLVFNSTNIVIAILKSTNFDYFVACNIVCFQQPIIISDAALFSVQLQIPQLDLKLNVFLQRLVFIFFQLKHTQMKIGIVPSIYNGENATYYYLQDGIFPCSIFVANNNMVVCCVQNALCIRDWQGVVNKAENI